MTERLAADFFSLLVPNEEITLSKWCDQNAYLSADTSAMPGKFTPYPFQRGILDAMTDPNIRKVTFMKSARVGYTSAIDQCIAYYLSYEPCPILMVLPRGEDVLDYSKNEIGPLIRDTPLLADLAAKSVNFNDRRQKLSKRTFVNSSSIQFVGSNSEVGFTRITCRVIIADEIDKYPLTGSGRSGDTIQLAYKRSETFTDTRKLICGATPSIKGFSRIESLFSESDQRYFHVPCPKCHHKHILKWENIRWDHNASGESVTENTHFVCPKCAGIIEQKHRLAMLNSGEWIATKPEVKESAGFHIWSAYSPHVQWAEIVEDFLRSRKDPILLKQWVNETKGESFEEDSSTVEGSLLALRREMYTRDSIPVGVNTLVAGIDTQDDRLEISVIGYGAGEECWYIDHNIIHGDPSQKTLWIDLDKYLLGVFKREDSQEMRIRAVCADTGGHFASAVMDFCKSRGGRKIWPIKGSGTSRRIFPLRSSRGKWGQLFLVGVDCAKDTVFSRLKISEPGPGYYHFPATEVFNDEFFAQLAGEVSQTRMRNGSPYRIWVPKRNVRHEVWDCARYALAAKASLGGRSTMLQAPRPMYAATDEKIPPAARASEPTSVITLEDFPVVVKKRRSIASMLAH